MDFLKICNMGEKFGKHWFGMLFTVFLWLWTACVVHCKNSLKYQNLVTEVATSTSSKSHEITHDRLLSKKQKPEVICETQTVTDNETGLLWVGYWNNSRKIGFMSLCCKIWFSTKRGESISHCATITPIYSYLKMYYIHFIITRDNIFWGR